ncbi:excinuclease ABC subunit UvrB, partial [bacterium]|nr:excinuclease ABC subunit UvrB [bacterium]
MPDFKLVSSFEPAGDQPQAIDSLVNGCNQQKKDQILLGVTGSGKTFTIAKVIEQIQKPTLVIAHNKTLAAQLCSEFQAFFPNNAVEYFVSYYDYYQPEAYLPARDMYIEKEVDINEEIERLRHHATRALLTRKDVIIVASVSCIYGLGSPENYIKNVINLEQGKTVSRTKLLRDLEKIQYERNDIELKKGRYRVKGETIDIFPSWENTLIRLDFFGDELEHIYRIHPVSLEVFCEEKEIDIYPATHYVVNDNFGIALDTIREEADQRLKELEAQDKVLEAYRLKTKINYDLEMMREIGSCKGIENYSRHLENRVAGTPPQVLLDFLGDDFLTVIDESHVTVPQIKGMYKGDQARKTVLVDYGFRLPSAMDNRPLKFAEFEQKVKRCIYVSATPGIYELDKCELTAIKPDSKNSSVWSGYDITEQIIRPTWLVDPEIIVRETKYQIDDLLKEINERVECKERVFITTLTKRMSEDLTSFLEEKEIKVRYLHSEIDTLDRIDILHDLRLGKFDVLVGVNLLREGLDIPEVSLVAIMDADKEGFLRNERALIQTMGRAARNINGKVILYADKMTKSMQAAINETNRRRDIQLAYNEKHQIKPRSIIKKIADIRDEDRKLIQELATVEMGEFKPDELPQKLAELERKMQKAAKNLEFEVAAVLRDKIEELLH